MKTKNLFIAALGTFLFAGCMNDEFIGTENSPTVANTETDAINFGFGMQNATRASLYGSDAATKLGNTFVVYGTKHATTEDETAAKDAVVFNNFQVTWAANTAGTTESNSSDWEYVGKQAYGTNPSSQGIKYWDYSADGGYTFYAFSSSDISFPQASSTDKVVVTKTTADASNLHNKGYEVTVKNGATLNNLYFSDRVPVAKAQYGNIVNLTFYNLGAKVRVGFYETIPGYKVQIKKFYIDDDAAAAVTDFAKMKDEYTTGFGGSLQNINSAIDQTLKVTYYDGTSGTIENRPTMAITTSGGYNWNLKLGNNLLNTDLSENSATPTWDLAGGEYTPVFPFEGNVNPLLIKLDFDLTADDNSTGEVIHVKGARAIVPAEYVKWKSNFAYTYIFKISDKTNGTTGDVDVNGDPTEEEGLKAITFDAIVVNIADERQETITTVSTNSITTYAKGQIVDEYNAGEPIYIAVTDNSTHNVITPSAIGEAATEAQVYKITAGTASEAKILASLNGLPMGITKAAVTGTEVATIESTVPLADGTNATIKNVKFTPSAAGTYAFVYTTTAYVATTYTNQSSGTYNSSATYYLRSGSAAPYVYYAVPVADAATFNANKANLYTVNVPGTTGVYDVKVIKVQ